MVVSVGRIYCPFRVNDDRCGISLSYLKIDDDEDVYAIKNKAASNFDSDDYESGSGSGSGSGSSEEGKCDYDSDLSDYENCDGTYTLEEIKTRKREFKDWYAAKREAKDLDVEFDRSGACNMKSPKYRSLNPDLWDYIVDLLKTSKTHVREFLFEFSRPVEPWVDGGGDSWGDLNTMHQGSATNDDSAETQWLRRALYVYNNHINKPPKLQFMGLNRVVSYLFHHFITFTALNRETGLTGTYQAAIVPDCFLLFLRHVEADKLLAYMDF